MPYYCCSRKENETLRLECLLCYKFRLARCFLRMMCWKYYYKRLFTSLDVFFIVKFAHLQP